MDWLVAVIIIVVAIFVIMWILMFLMCYRKCPSDKIMVIYGKVADKDGIAQSAICIHGGAKFVWPLIQSYKFLDLTPIVIDIDLKNTRSKQNVRVNILSRFTVGISTEHGIMQNAAERLLGLSSGEIQELAKDIILGQLRIVIAEMDIEYIDNERDIFLDAVSRNIEYEIRKIGLRLINVNLNDIIIDYI